MILNFPRVYLANDDSTHEGAIKKARMIEGVDGGYGIKLNIDLILRGSRIITDIGKITGRPIFTDLKMNNGKRTMDELVKEVADCGSKMVNAYVQADRLLEKALKTAESYGMIFLGVTVTTHFNEAYCREYYKRSLPETVKFLAEKAIELGFHGYIVPGTMLPYVEGIKGIRFIPATRPDWFEDKKTNDQEQVISPSEAIMTGADIVSCGSPVFKSPDPKEALRKILDEVDMAWEKRS